MEFAVLSGDPENGEYTQVRKVPAGTDNPLHTHSSEIKNVIVSGVWYTGADAASTRDFGPGSVIVMPAGWVHVSGCRAGKDCVFYQEGKGKFDSTRGASEHGQVSRGSRRDSPFVGADPGAVEPSAAGGAPALTARAGVPSLRSLGAPGLRSLPGKLRRLVPRARRAARTG